MMTPDAMEAFRAEYRANINKRYNGWRHMGFVALVGFGVIAYSINQLHQPSLLEACIFPATMLLINFAEYYAHRWLGHRKTRIGKLFYSRHTGDHHSFFLSSHMAYQSTRDWRVVLFPALLIIVFLLGLITPISYLLGTFFSMNAAYLFTAGALSGYVFYEIMHFSYHVPPGSKTEAFFLLFPGWKQLRHTHVLHHKREIMANRNFNITLPVFDILLGTFYWEPLP